MVQTSFFLFFFYQFSKEIQPSEATSFFLPQPKYYYVLVVYITRNTGFFSQENCQKLETTNRLFFFQQRQTNLNTSFFFPCCDLHPSCNATCSFFYLTTNVPHKDTKSATNQSDGHFPFTLPLSSLFCFSFLADQNCLFFQSLWFPSKSHKLLRKRNRSVAFLIFFFQTWKQPPLLDLRADLCPPFRVFFKEFAQQNGHQPNRLAVAFLMQVGFQRQ